MLLLSEDEELDEAGEIIEVLTKRKEEQALEEGDCQILDFMGMRDTSTPYPKTLKLLSE